MLSRLCCQWFQENSKHSMLLWIGAWRFCHGEGRYHCKQNIIRKQHLDENSMTIKYILSVSIEHFDKIQSKLNIWIFWQDPIKNNLLNSRSRPKAVFGYFGLRASAKEANQFGLNILTRFNKNYLMNNLTGFNKK